MITNHEVVAHTCFSELEACLGAKATHGTCWVKFRLVEWGEVNTPLPVSSASTSPCCPHLPLSREGMYFLDLGSAWISHGQQGQARLTVNLF